MDWGDRVVYILLGCVLGYVVRLLQEMATRLDEVDKHVQESKDHTHDRNENGLLRMKPHLRDIAIFAVVVATVWAAIQTGETNKALKENIHQDTVSRCEAGEEVRYVLRDIVEAIYKLATGSLERAPDAPPLTDEELKAYNAYIKRVNSFRSDMYDRIEPSKECKPYVKDDNVDPPTGSFPPMTQ